MNTAKTRGLDVEGGVGGFQEIILDGNLTGGKGTGDKGIAKLGVTKYGEFGANNQVVG